MSYLSKFAVRTYPKEFAAPEKIIAAGTPTDFITTIHDGVTVAYYVEGKAYYANFKTDTFLAFFEESK